MENYRFAFIVTIAIVVVIWLIKDDVARSYQFRQRTKNIKNAGWPPAHLDADGDLHRENDK